MNCALFIRPGMLFIHAYLFQYFSYFRSDSYFVYIYKDDLFNHTPIHIFACKGCLTPFLPVLSKIEYFREIDTSFLHSFVTKKTFFDFGLLFTSIVHLILFILVFFFTNFNL